MLLQRVNWSGLGVALSQVHVPSAIVASLLTPLLIAVLAVRWWILLRQHGIPIAPQGVLGLTWAGQFFNSVLPGSTGGDIVKVYQLCRSFPNHKAAAAVSVVVDRLSALVALATLAGAALILGPTLKAEQLGLSVRASWTWLLVCVVLGAAGAALGYRFVMRSPQWLARLRQLLTALKTNLKFNTANAVVLVLAFVIHLLNFGIFFAFSRALGIELTYLQVLAFMPVVFALLLLPVTVNGHGLREILLIFYFTQMQISLVGRGVGTAETVVSLSVLGVANDLLWALPGGIWYLTRAKAPPAAVDARHNPPGEVHLYEQERL